uniref:Carbonic anhydrase n=1 Tax=Chelydra serpentina TaxID=8475 RepID=A0A8C3S4V5_CHESE
RAGDWLCAGRACQVRTREAGQSELPQAGEPGTGCGQTRDNQSPIEINSKEVHYEPSLLPWFVGYDPVGARAIVNNGRTCKVVFDDTFDRSGYGPLPGLYRLRQLHFHWGSSNDHGSEHIVDGVKYAGELHLVHWYSKYSNYAEALRNYDGVAILGIFLQVSRSAHSFLVLLHTFAPFSNFDPSILFPKSWDYWTYHGSFTTPPCEECVTWILLREPIIVSPDQVNFRGTLTSLLSWFSHSFGLFIYMPYPSLTLSIRKTPLGVNRKLLE